MPDGPAARAPLAKIVGAFLAIYLIWGSTFLAIHVAIADMPPVFMCALRLLAAGVLLVAWSWLRGEPWPRGAEWTRAAFVGVLLPGIGNTSVTIGVAHVHSGLVALLLATIPLWVALFLAFGPREARPSRPAIVGLVLGFAGIALLIGPGLSGAGHAADAPLWALVPIGGAFSWAWGTLWSRRHRMPRSPLMTTGVGLVAGGLLATVASGVSGEFARVPAMHVGLPAWLALGYLVVFGSIVGYSCYLYLLRVVSPAVVSTYAFVNPVVAMALGWVFADEVLSGRVLLAAALVISSVVLVTWAQARRVVRAGVAAASGAARMRP